MPGSMAAIIIIKNIGTKIFPRSSKLVVATFSDLDLLNATLHVRATGRLKGHLIELYKGLKDFEDVGSNIFFSRGNKIITRNVGRKLKLPQINYVVAGNFFLFKV